MKKEYLILTILILALGAYLFLHKEGRDNYTLPELPGIETEKVTAIVIEKEGTVVDFTQKDGKWQLTEKQYPADGYLVDNILATFKNFRLSTLVSQKGDLKRYELDKAGKIKVELKQDDKTVFEVSVGKTAPTFNHTFVMMADDPNVYHAAGSFRSDLDKQAADFRDKTVLEFKASSLKKIILNKKEVSKTLVAGVKAQNAEEKDQDTAPAWQSDDGSTADAELVSSLMDVLSDLDCEAYPEMTRDDLEKNFSLLYKIVLENDTHHELILFEKPGEETLTGFSTMNGYVVELSQYSSTEIKTNTDKLLGVYKSEDQKE